MWIGIIEHYLRLTSRRVTSPGLRIPVRGGSFLRQERRAHARTSEKAKARRDRVASDRGTKDRRPPASFGGQATDLL